MTKKTKAKVKEMTEREKIKLFKKLQSDILAVKDEIYGFKKKVKDQQDIIEYFKTISPIDKEVVYAIFLNAKNKIIDFDKISDGTLTQSLLYPREIVKTCLELGALSIVICHNHPSGDPQPSENDKKITKKLLFATKEMDIVILDHIILGGKRKQYYSFYEEGLIDKYNNDYKHLQSTLT